MKRAWIAGLMIVGALAAGCGDDDGDDGDDGARSSQDPAASDADSTELPKFCDLVTADQVSGAVGATVSLETAPFDACEFSQEDPRAISGSLGAVQVDVGNGGFDAYRSGSVASLEGGVDHPLAGIGDDAYVVTGSFGGGESLQAAGGALVGGDVYTVNLAQSEGLGKADLVRIAEALLQLLVDAT